MSNSNPNELVKISFIGAPAVGKTTILKLLSEKTIDKTYIPTMGLDQKTVKFGKFNLKVWDFGGQKAYIKMYLPNYLMGSDIVFVVTDSTARNVLTSRELIDFSRDIIGEDCPIIAIANKQDLLEADGRMDPERVSNVLCVDTVGLTAIKRSERKRFLNYIKKELNKVLIRKRLEEE
ncbi:MAG: ADP-ribosylation factor-like protein [Promethearchaeota archaeon]